MIIRLFRVRIFDNMADEFEEKFATVSVGAVEKASGLQSVAIYRPTKWNQGEYAMISVWDSEADLERFAGENWNKAFIPEGMDRYIDECWIDHFQEW